MMGTAKLMPNISAVYSSDEDGKVDHKRMAHNQIERRRKVKINNWIYRLGGLLPGINKDKKPSKNLILEKAVEYIKELRDTNEQLLLGHTSEVQAREFQQMKSRIEELELRNSELTRYIESAGTWQQRTKYSHKLDPDSVGFQSCSEKSNLNDKTTKRETGIHGGELTDATCAIQVKTTTQELVDATVIPPLTSTSQFIVQNGVVFVQNGDSVNVSKAELLNSVKSCQNENLIRTSDVNGTQQEFAVQPNVLNTNITAVTQALPSIPIMSTTSQQTSANQQVLQQLPVLNYGNTVNIFPGLVGQGQPMIIINENGVPLLQNMMPGQLLLNPTTGQTVVCAQCCNTTNSPLLTASAGSISLGGMSSTSSDLPPHSSSVLLNSLSGQGLPVAGATNHILVNAALNQTNESGGNLACAVSGGQVVMKPTRSCALSKLNSFQSHEFNKTSLGTNGQLIISVTTQSSLNSTQKERPVITSSQANAQSIALACMNSQPGTNSIFQPANCGNINVANLGNARDAFSLGTSTMPLKSCGSNTVLVSSTQSSVPTQGLITTDQQQMQTMFTSQMLNRTAFVQPQSNSLQILPQQTLQRDSNTILNSVANSSPLPSALLLPNGQLIPVVSQPSLIYPGASPITGGLLMAPPHQPTTLFQPPIQPTTTIVAPPQPKISKASVVTDTTTVNRTATGIQSNSTDPTNDVNKCRQTTSSACTTNAHRNNTTSPFNSSVIFTVAQQNDYVKSLSTPGNSCSKKSVKRSPRVIKPKPSASSKVVNANSGNVDKTSSTGKSSNANSNKRSSGGGKERSAMNSFDINTTNANQKGASSKPLCIATDILAKATESIFSSAMSDPSPPISRFYNCDSADYPENSNISSDNKKTEETNDHDKSEEKDDGNNDQNSDILNDLVADVYSVEDRDMPLLEPISPAVRSDTEGHSEKSLADVEGSSEENAPNLSAIIPDSTSVSTKRSQDSPTIGFPLKRIRQDRKKDDVRPTTKDEADFTPSCTSNNSSGVNFLSVSQLASSSFTIDTTLCNENSPLGSISPLLVSPTKSNGSDGFLAATTTTSLMNNTCPSGFESTTDANLSNQNCVNSLSGSMHESRTTVRQQSSVESVIHKNAESTDVSSQEFSLHATQNQFELQSPSRHEANPNKNQISGETTRNPQAEFGNDDISTSKSAGIVTSLATATSASRVNNLFTSSNFATNSMHLMDAKNLTPDGLHTNSDLNLNLPTATNNSTSPFVGTMDHMTTSLARPGECSNVPRPPLVNMTGFSGNLVSTATTIANLPCNTNALQSSSFSMPDLLHSNLSNVSSVSTSVNNSNAVHQVNQPVGESTLLSNEVMCDNVPSFNFGLFGQVNQIQSCVSSTNSAQSQMQMPLSTFNQNYLQTGMNQRRSTPVSTFHATSKTKLLTNRRNSTTEEILSPTGVPLRSPGANRVNTASTSLNLMPGHGEVTQQPSTQPVTSLVYNTRRSNIGGSNYSAEALISQGTYVSAPKHHHHHHHPFSHSHLSKQSMQQQQQPQQQPQQQQQHPQLPQQQQQSPSSRPIISYSAESLIQTQADRRSNCSQSQQSCLVLQSAAIRSNNSSVATSSYTATNTTQPLYFTMPHQNSKQSNNSQPTTLMHFDVPGQKNICSSGQHQNDQPSFSFSLGHGNTSTQSSQQNQSISMYPPNMFHYAQTSAGLPPSQGQKQLNMALENSMFPQQMAPCLNVAPTQQQVTNVDGNFTAQFSEQFSNNNSNPSANANNRTDVSNVAANFPDVCKMSADKGKAKQENNSSKGSKSSKQQNQIKKKHFNSVEEVNLSNSIFETNRSVTPYFGVPNLSSPRNEAPTYIPNPNALFNTQRCLATNSATQNKAPDVGSSYNSLFPTRSQTGLNLNFQAPGFGMNHVHATPTAMPSQISNHSNVTNFNLSNIFPDINNSGESLNISQMKFHPGNSILSTDAQHHQPNPLYNRPVLHNGMSINTLLAAHTPHGFDATRTQMPMSNGMPPAFHGHTPSFSNVVPTLNFTMHEH